VCTFSGGRARSSVFGVRPSALIRYRVPGSQVPNSWYLIPGTQYRALVFENPHAGYARCRIQDAHPVCAFSNNRFPGSVFGARYPALGIDPVRVPGVRYRLPRYLIRSDAGDRARLLGNTSMGFASYIPHGRVFRNVRQRFRLIARLPYCAPGTLRPDTWYRIRRRPDTEHREPSRSRLILPNGRTA